MPSETLHAPRERLTDCTVATHRSNVDEFATQLGKRLCCVEFNIAAKDSLRSHVPLAGC
ncbi:MAG: hypothetical protein M3Q30_23210 [Actinomycetota bacterium]|nr:hypothetical protein [Actinomycetota bacterium]